MQLTGGKFGGARIVRNHYDRLALRAIQRLQQIHDLFCVLAIKVAGRLVTDQQRWIRDDGTCDRDALLLTARELVRFVLAAVGQTDQVQRRLAGFAPSIRELGGGLTISGGEPMVQLAFTRRIFEGAKAMGLHTAVQTSGFLGDRADDAYLSAIDLVLLDIKSSDPATYRRVTGRDLAPTLRFAERLAAMSKPVWVRLTLVPGETDDPANVDGIARFVAPMKNVEWVEVQPFHQMGAFKWKSMGLEYKLADTPPASKDLVNRVIGQFRTAGCRVR